MKKLFTIYDSFLVDTQGTVIAGINSEFDYLDKSEIQHFIGKKVILKRQGEQDLTLHVKAIEISVSLINKKNIFIYVADKILPEEIPSGSEIYSCS